MVNLLLCHGATVPSSDKREKQAIHWAAYHGKGTTLCLIITSKPVTAYYAQDLIYNSSWRFLKIGTTTLDCCLIFFYSNAFANNNMSVRGTVWGHGQTLTDFNCLKSI